MISRKSRIAEHDEAIVQAEIKEGRQMLFNMDLADMEKRVINVPPDPNSKWPQGYSETKMGSEFLDEAIAEPTLDRYLDRSPKVGNPIDYPAMVAILHRKREMFITAEQKKKEPKSDE